MSRMNVCVLLFACLATCVTGSVLCDENVSPSGDDLVKQISSAIPRDWSVELTGGRERCFVQVITNEMETKHLPYGNARPGIDREKTGVTLQVLPRYSPAMLERIKQHNKSLKEKLKAVKYSDENRRIESELIDEPMFYDKNYGITILFPTRVPNKAEDSQKLMDVMQKITREWKSYDPTKRMSWVRFAAFGCYRKAIT